MPAVPEDTARAVAGRAHTMASSLLGPLVRELLHAMELDPDDPGIWEPFTTAFKIAYYVGVDFGLADAAGQLIEQGTHCEVSYGASGIDLLSGVVLAGVLRDSLDADDPSGAA